MINTNAFDAFADDYDADFTDSRLGRMLRPRVWTHLAEAFTADDHVLELTCGTGEDALWLAQRGINVTATDGSAKMIQVTRDKAEAAGVSEYVTASQASLQDIIAGQINQPFDGVFSNFGGLNTIEDWAALAEALAPIIKPGSKAILVPMGPYCPWEVKWHLAHGQLKTAFRRFDGPATARIGDTDIPIWYPSARQLRTAFAPWFKLRHIESLGLWLPPSYLDHLVDRWPSAFERLAKLEAATAHLTKGWGDHYIAVFERT